MSAAPIKINNTIVKDSACELGIFGCIISMLGSSTVYLSNLTASNITTNESNGNIYVRDSSLVIDNSYFSECNAASVSWVIYV